MPAPDARHAATSSAPRASPSLGNDYLDIATLALQRLGEIAGPDAVRQFAVERFADMERRYAPEIDAGRTGHHRTGAGTVRSAEP